MKLRTNWLVLLICFPLFAQAQGFKCKLADGSLSFQEQPCPAGATSSAMPYVPETSGIGGPAVPPSKGAPARAISREPRQVQGQVQDRDQERKRRQAEEEVNAYNQEVKAYNKMQQCNYARSQVAVAKRNRPIYRLNDKGEQQFVEDSNRSAEIAAAEQRAAEACN